MSTKPTRSIHEDLEFIRNVADILERSLDVREIVNPIMDAMTTHLEMKHATITLLNRKTNDILIDASHGLTPQQAQRGRYKLGEGVTGQVIESGEPILVERTGESPLFLNRTQRMSSQESSFICVPIKTGKTVVGALSADRPYEEGKDLHEAMELMELVASLLAQSVRLRRSAQERGEKLQSENERLRAELKDRFRPSNIIGNSHEMQIVYDQIAQVSKSQTSVLIEGETGTGKELVAHAIHFNSDRADKPFIKAHCAALPENLIESELFGHVKGSFTGATGDRKGRFSMADGGTLFLDEIGEIPPAIQIKLLRVLQEREFEPVGSTKTQKVNVRVIAATNRNLQDMVNEGSFREDLFYRLNVFPIWVPPLRKRKSDILQLADFFLERYSKQNNKNVRRLSSPVIDMLYSYHWPGNVRELENIMERGVVLAENDALHPHHLPPTLQTAEQVGAPKTGSLKDQVETYEKDLISDALKSARGNMAAAARALSTTQRIFGYKVHKYNINPKQYAG
jgi:Nif-specific regulatory protein